MTRSWCCHCPGAGCRRDGSFPPAVGGVIALLQDGDKITIDAIKGTIDVDLSEKELAERKSKWKPRTNNYQSGALWRYSQNVGNARNGAITHPGAKAEVQCYADI